MVRAAAVQPFIEKAEPFSSYKLSHSVKKSLRENITNLQSEPSHKLNRWLVIEGYKFRNPIHLFSLPLLLFVIFFNIS